MAYAQYTAARALLEERVLDLLEGTIQRIRRTVPIGETNRAFADALDRLERNIGIARATLQANRDREDDEEAPASLARESEAIEPEDWETMSEDIPMSRRALHEIWRVYNEIEGAPPIETMAEMRGMLQALAEPVAHRRPWESPGAMIREALGKDVSDHAVDQFVAYADKLYPEEYRAGTAQRPKTPMGMEAERLHGQEMLDLGLETFPELERMSKRIPMSDKTLNEVLDAYRAIPGVDPLTGVADMRMVLDRLAQQIAFRGEGETPAKVMRDMLQREVGPEAAAEIEAYSKNLYPDEFVRGEGLKAGMETAPGAKPVEFPDLRLPETPEERVAEGKWAFKRIAEEPGEGKPAPEITDQDIEGFRELIAKARGQMIPTTANVESFFNEWIDGVGKPRPSTRDPLKMVVDPVNVEELVKRARQRFGKSVNEEALRDGFGRMFIERIENASGLELERLLKSTGLYREYGPSTNCATERRRFQRKRICRTKSTCPKKWRAQRLRLKPKLIKDSARYWSGQ